MSFKIVNTLNIPPVKYDRKIKTQRNRRGLEQAVEHAVQFDNKRETLPGLEMPEVVLMKVGATVKSESGTGAAWSSSACGVSCSVKSGNMRNPRPMLNSHRRLSLFKRRKVGMT